MKDKKIFLTRFTDFYNSNFGNFLELIGFGGALYGLLNKDYDSVFMGAIFYVVGGNVQSQSDKQNRKISDLEIKLKKIISSRNDPTARGGPSYYDRFSLN